MPADRSEGVRAEVMYNILDWYDGPLEGYARCQEQLVHYSGVWPPDMGGEGVHDIFYALTVLPETTPELAARLEQIEREPTVLAQLDPLADQLELLEELRGEQVPTMWATMRWGERGRVIWEMIDEATFIQMTAQADRAR